MKKISFGALLRNDRLMILLSILLAVGLWYFVLSGSSNVTTRTITCTLTTANVRNGALQVIESETIAVEVEVQGAWSEITKLTADDLRVQLNSSDIQNPGSSRIRVLASRNSQATDYEIVSTSPSTVTLFCDEWVEGRLFEIKTGGITAEAPLVTAEGDNRDIGKVTIDPLSLPGGVISVQGPNTVVSKIAQLTARVAEETTITEQQSFSAGIVALDAGGNEVDLQHCTLMCYAEDPANNLHAALTDMTENVVDVIVTVNERREITFTYDVLNAPGGVDLSQIVTILPATVTLEGEKELLEQYAEQLTHLVTLDFDTLTTDEKGRSIPITLPEGLVVVGTGERELNVRLSFDWTGYRKRTLTWDIGTDLTNTPINFTNVPADKTITMRNNTLVITVFGKRAAVEALKPEDLTALVDMSSSSLGTYSIRPEILSQDLWVYYGTTGYTVYLDIV